MWYSLVENHGETGTQTAVAGVTQPSIQTSSQRDFLRRFNNITLLPPLLLTDNSHNSHSHTRSLSENHKQRSVKAFEQTTSAVVFPERASLQI